jgi:hypothetical protein
MLLGLTKLSEKSVIKRNIFFMFIIEGDVTIAEIDDALGYISIQLRTDKFGDRMTWKKRQTLMSSADDLLDERLIRMAALVSVG